MQFIVYGCGTKAEEIITKNSNNVYGVMDHYKTGQLFCGKCVFSNDEIANIGIKKIVIAARKASIPIIYRRIADFCRDNGIDILDENFNQVEFDFSGKNELCFSHSETFSEEIKQKIISADAVSFDVFDTLIGRRCLYHTDITEDFETEKRLTYTRKEIIDYYDFAKKAGKKVYFCSDMYLKSEQICELLNKNDMDAEVEDIIVSYEHGVEKINGLFDVLKRKVGDKKILHIGDSYEADYIAAKTYGLEAVKIDNRLDILEKSKWNKLLKYDNTPDNSRVIGELLASDLKLADLISPLVYKFVAWIRERSQELDFILLAARDGWLIDIIRKTFSQYYFEGAYFLVSRTAAVSAAIMSEADFDETNKYNFSGTTDEIYEKRFALDKIAEVSEVVEHSKRLRDNYIEYTRSLGICDDARVGFLDLVAAGTCLRNLRKFLPFCTKGLYMARIEEFSYHSAEDEFLYQFPSDNNILKKYFILEEYFSSDMPTLKCFDDRSEPVYFNERRTDSQIQNKNSIQAEVLDYGKRTLDLDFSKVDLGLCDEILGMIDAFPEIAEDEFCGR